MGYSKSRIMIPESINHSKQKSPKEFDNIGINTKKRKTFSIFSKKGLAIYQNIWYYIGAGYLGIAQIGSALPWGGRGRGFKSRYSDQ